MQSGRIFSREFLRESGLALALVVITTASVLYAVRASGEAIAIVRLNFVLVLVWSLAVYLVLRLRALSRLVAFFQGRNTFSYSEMPVPESRLEGQDRDNLRLIFDLYTLTFEQINHLWGSLGGKQRPFAMYKVRVVPIRYDHLLDAGSVIERVRNDTAG